MSSARESVESAGPSDQPSRQSNLNKSVSGDSEPPPEEKRAAEVAAQVRRFEEAYPVRAKLPVAAGDGTAVRRDYAHVEESVETVHDDIISNGNGAYEVDNGDVFEVSKVEDVSAVSWSEAVEILLHQYLRTEATTVNLERDGPDGLEEYSVSAENRWMPVYQKKYFGQLDAWLRELTGGERPSGGETEATFENPKVALLTRSASSWPDAERLSPVNHAQAVRDSWEPVYHQLRNTLRAGGYELGEDWMYWRAVEPHQGKRGDGRGINECYAHEHIIVVVDGDVSAETFEPAISKHVEECDLAGADAHGEDAIEVRDPDELENVAAYVADYCSIDPESLMERDPDYIGFAAAMTAANMRTVTRSEAARHAADGDACKQRYESEASDQDVDHGEEVRRAVGGQSHSIECAECGSPHGIDQDQTLTAATAGDGPAAVADGGVDVRDREAELRGRWPSATAAATVGETRPRAAAKDRIRTYLRNHPDADDRDILTALLTELPPPETARELVAEVRADGFDVTEPAGFAGGVGKWEVVSVTVDGEESPASGGNGIEMVEVRDDREQVAEALDVEDGDGPLLRCPECEITFGPSAAVGHLVEKHDLGETPELASEFVTAVE